MRHLLSSLALIATLSTYCAAGDTEHVILISCDGMRPDAIAFLGEDGAPNLHRLRKRERPLATRAPISITRSRCRTTPA